jgi:hypothetical protein
MQIPQILMALRSFTLGAVLADAMLFGPAYAADLPDVFAVLPATTAKSDTLMLDVFTCGCDEHLPGHKAKLDEFLTLDVFSVGPVASKPAEVPSPAVPVKPPVKQQIAPQAIQYAAPTCRFVWTRFGWQQVCQ